jgi:hypothetical protein
MHPLCSLFLVFVSSGGLLRDPNIRFERPQEPERTSFLQPSLLNRTRQDDYKLDSALSGPGDKPCGVSSMVEVPSPPSLLAKDSGPRRAQNLPATTALSSTALFPQPLQSACAFCCLESSKR